MKDASATRGWGSGWIGDSPLSPSATLRHRLDVAIRLTDVVLPSLMEDVAGGEDASSVLGERPWETQKRDAGLAMQNAQKEERRHQHLEQLIAAIRRPGQLGCRGDESASPAPPATGGSGLDRISGSSRPMLFAPCPLLSGLREVIDEQDELPSRVPTTSVVEGQRPTSRHEQERGAGLDMPEHPSSVPRPESVIAHALRRDRLLLSNRQRHAHEAAEAPEHVLGQLSPTAEMKKSVTFVGNCDRGDRIVFASPACCREEELDLSHATPHRRSSDDLVSKNSPSSMPIVRSTPTFFVASLRRRLSNCSALQEATPPTCFFSPLTAEEQQNEGLVGVISAERQLLEDYTPENGK